MLLEATPIFWLVHRETETKSGLDVIYSYSNTVCHVFSISIEIDKSAKDAGHKTGPFFLFATVLFGLAESWEEGKEESCYSLPK